MINSWVSLILLVSAAVTLRAFGDEAYPASMFEERLEGAGLWKEFPNVELSNEERVQLFLGVDRRPVIRELESKSGARRAWMAFSVESMPPTVWQVVTNIENFHLEDPVFPESNGRRTFMPYVRYGHACFDEDSIRLFQYLRFPMLIADRKYTVIRTHDSRGYPWEVHWENDLSLSCRGSPPQEYKAGIAKAVHVKTNTGGWRIGPTPSQYFVGTGDLERTLVIYYVESNPGGRLSKAGFLRRISERRALPKLARLVRFHSARWEEYLREHGTSEQLATHKVFCAAYRRNAGLDR